MRRGPAAAALLLPLALAGCDAPPRVLQVAGRVLAGQAEDGRPGTLPPAVRVLAGEAPEVRAYAVHGLIRPSLVLHGAARLRLTVPPGARTLRFSVAVRPAGRSAEVRVSDPARPGAEPLWTERIKDARAWVDREVALADAPRELEVAVATRADAVALGSLRFESEADTPHPSVLVYLVDCLRAGYLGAWGHRGGASPALDALAAGGVRFLKTTSCASWTKPSTGCLFTSLYPDRHGARTADDVLDPRATSLAQRFQAAGYTTAAFVANPVLDHQWFGFGRGFDHYLAMALRERNRGVNAFNTDAADLTRAVLEWMQVHRDRRFFVYAHALDLHAPYAAHPPFDRVGPDGVASEPRTDEERYLRELAYNDRQFGALVEGMKKAGTYDRTMIVVLSDHGEEFGEHGIQRHGMSLYDTVLHIPWIVKLPDGRAAGVAIDEPAVNLDVAPTLLELAGLPAPKDVQGVSLAPLVDGRPGPGPREIYAEQMSGRFALWAVRSRGLKLIHRLVPEPGLELFDLAADPGERRDLAASRPADVARLRRNLDPFMAASVEGLHLRFGGMPDGTRMTVKVAAGAELGPVTRLVIRMGDELVVAPDRRSVTLSIDARGHEPRHVVVAPGASRGSVTVTASVGARTLAAAAVRLGATGAGAPAVPFDVVPATLGALPAGAPPGAAPFLQVGNVAPRTPRPLALDPRLTEDLRALGYVQ